MINNKHCSRSILLLKFTVFDLRDAGMDASQNLMDISLSKDKSPVKFFYENVISSCSPGLAG